MYSMMLTAQGEASTPVAEGTLPEERCPPLGVELHRSVADDYLIPPDTGRPPAEVVLTQCVANYCLHRLVSVYLLVALSMEWDIK